MLKAIEYALEHQCSDIHITQGYPFAVRDVGVIKKIGDRAITANDITNFIRTKLPHRYQEFIAKESVDIDASFEQSDRRFRANIYKSISGITLALRLLSNEIPALESLSLPTSTEMFCRMDSGLVLVVGTTGSGKTTTLAGIIDKINKTRAVNILTIEDPIEYLYKEKLARIVQREIGTHVESFALATRAAMRQDPDCVLIGELRDLETISNAMTIAETGHLVFATIHAKSAIDTIYRIIDVFPPEVKEQIRTQLASVLRGVVYQKLLPNLNGGRTPIAEIFMLDDTLAGMILQKQKPNAIRDYVRYRKSSGGVHLADDILKHIQNNSLTLESIKNAISREDYSLVNSQLHSLKSKRGDLY